MIDAFTRLTLDWASGPWPGTGRRQNLTEIFRTAPLSCSLRVATGQGKSQGNSRSGKSQGNSRSGKSQGIIEFVREIWNIVESQGNLRKRQGNSRKFIFHMRLR